MKVYAVSNGLHQVLCETQEDAELVKRELKFHAWAGGWSRALISVTEIEVTEIPVEDANYLYWLKDITDVA